MGTFVKGILGGFSGLIGTVIGTTWRGLDVMRSRPRKSSKPAVQSVLDQRSRFALMIAFLTRVKAYIEVGFNADGKAITPMNAAVNYNLNFAITGVSPNFSIDYTKLILSRGTLVAADNIVVTPAASRTLNVAWADYQDPDGDADNAVLRNTDKVSFFYYNPVTNKSLRGVMSGTRGAKSAKTVLSLAVTNGGADGHLWLFFQSADGKLISESQYMGQIKPLA